MAKGGQQIQTSEASPQVRDHIEPGIVAGRLRVVMVRLGRQLRRYDSPGLGISLYSALATIARQKEISIGELADCEQLPSSGATRLADHLEKAGLIERKRNPNDRRGVNLVATAAGLSVLKHHRERGNSELAQHLQSLSRAELATLLEAIQILETLLADDQVVASKQDRRSFS
ncbi:MAG: MarR family transcriptional regulator [Actinobacteria bacterium]|jgi:DNA-binding MarR family transcriptional regulator|nr:MarR family transcriptional regulator [Actinomycetota bacterium]